MHEEPQVLHFGRPGTGLKLREGMVFTITLPAPRAYGCGALLRTVCRTRHGADNPTTMTWRIVFSLLICASLSGCSYVYEILAVVQHGRLVFIVDPKSSRHPSCVRQIEVTALPDHRASAASGDDGSRVRYGTFWSESVDYADDCANTYPLAYGSSLSGKPQPDREKVTLRPLLREVEYEVTATTGATGYGRGRFVVHRGGRVENLPPGP